MVLHVAIVGAESSGKTTLARVLTNELTRAGLNACWTPEVLREWCDAHQRTPRQDEQRAIAMEQSQRAAACADVEVCISDTTALMTAVYSDVLFGDTSLYPWAAADQARFDLTLLTDLYLAWQPDGMQRDGPHVRALVDAALRAALLAYGIPFQLISGIDGQRANQALHCVLTALSKRSVAADFMLQGGRSPQGRVSRFKIKRQSGTRA